MRFGHSFHAKESHLTPEAELQGVFGLRVISIIDIIYSLLSFAYVLVTYPQDRLIVSLLSPVFYLLFGIIVFVFSKQIVKLAIKGIDRE